MGGLMLLPIAVYSAFSTNHWFRHLWCFFGLDHAAGIAGRFAGASK
jgi:hypothetical protein